MSLKIALIFLVFANVMIWMRNIVECSDVVYWIGSNPIGYWQDPSNWENHQIPTLNQTVIINKPNKLRILHDLEVIKVKRIIIDGNSDNVVILENPMLISKGIEIGEYSKVIFSESVECLEGESCKLNVRGKVEVCKDDGLDGFWREKRNRFRIETCLINSQASFKISNRNNLGNSSIIEGIDEEFGDAFANHEILLFVPSTQNVNEQLAKEKLESLLERIISEIAQIVGGVTLNPNQEGYWMSNSEGLVKEMINIISVSVPDHLFIKTRRKIKEISLFLIDELHQEAIFVKIDSKSYLITKKK